MKNLIFSLIFLFAGFGFGAEKAMTVAEQIRYLNSCVMSSICNRQVTQLKTQNMNQALTSSGNAIIQGCAARGNITTPVMFYVAKFKQDDKLLDYNINYTEGGKLKYVKNVMNCPALSFIQDPNCNKNKNLKDIAALNSNPPEIKTYADVTCVDEVQSSSSLDSYKNNDGKYDFTKFKYGFGFRAEGKTCKKICGPNEVMAVPAPKVVSAKELWSQTLSYDYAAAQQEAQMAMQSSGGYSNYGMGSMNAVPVDPNAVPACQKCPAGQVTDETSNICKKSKTDKCGADQEVVESVRPALLSASYGGYTNDDSDSNSVGETNTTISCAAKCGPGMERANMLYCQPTAETKKAQIADLKKSVDSWDPEKSLRDQYYGACNGADLIPVAKAFKQETLSRIRTETSGHSYGGFGFYSQSFGSYLMTNAPEKCRTTTWDANTGQMKFKKIEANSVSDGMWKQLSGPGDTASGFGMGFGQGGYGMGIGGIGGGMYGGGYPSGGR